MRIILTSLLRFLDIPHIPDESSCDSVKSSYAFVPEKRCSSRSLTEWPSTYTNPAFLILTVYKVLIHAHFPKTKSKTLVVYLSNQSLHTHLWHLPICLQMQPWIHFLLICAFLDRKNRIINMFAWPAFLVMLLYLDKHLDCFHERRGNAWILSHDFNIENVVKWLSKVDLHISTRKV